MKDIILPYQATNRTYHKSFCHSRKMMVFSALLAAINYLPESFKPAIYIKTENPGLELHLKLMMTGLICSPQSIPKQLCY